MLFFLASKERVFVLERVSGHSPKFLLLPNYVPASALVVFIEVTGFSEAISRYQSRNSSEKMWIKSPKFCTAEY